jgi:hypothetical protein
MQIPVQLPNKPSSYSYMKEQYFIIIFGLIYRVNRDSMVFPLVNRPGNEATLTSSYCRCEENVDLYLHLPIHLHGVVLS